MLVYATQTLTDAIQTVNHATKTIPSATQNHLYATQTVTTLTQNHFSATKLKTKFFKKQKLLLNSNFTLYYKLHLRVEGGIVKLGLQNLYGFFSWGP